MQINKENIWNSLEKVKDPEIPVLSVVDLGVVRAVDIIDDQVEIKLIQVQEPTFVPLVRAVGAGND